MKNDFNRIAWCYDFLSRMVFGDNIKQSQILLIDHIKDNDRILIMGGGTGWIVNEILRLKRIGSIDYVETSTKMIQKAKAIIPSDSMVKINFIHGDEKSLIATDKYDVVICAYFFDLFKPDRLKIIVSQLVNSLKVGGKLLVADFNTNDSSPIQHKLLVKAMYLFFRITCGIEAMKIHGYHSVLIENELEKEWSVSSNGGLIVSELYRKVD